jgi:hypothetical protein
MMGYIWQQDLEVDTSMVGYIWNQIEIMTHNTLLLKAAVDDTYPGASFIYAILLLFFLIYLSALRRKRQTAVFSSFIDLFICNVCQHFKYSTNSLFS